MRILALYSLQKFWSMGEGKGASAFSRTLEALSARGHEVRVFLPSEKGEPEEVSAALGCALLRFPAERSFLPDPNLPVVPRLWDRWTAWRAYQAWGWRIGRGIVESFRPDLVLALGVPEAPLARRLARLAGAANATRLFGNNLSLNLGDPIRFYLNFPEVAAFRTRADLLLLTNDGANGEEVARRLGVDPASFQHLRNGLEFDLFAPGPGSPALRETIGARDGAPVLLTVTRLASEKRLERAIDAMPALLGRHPGATLAILGDGPERAPLEARARAAGVAERVRFMGAISRAELPEWYRTGDVLLSLLDRTNASNPVFEAMAAARVVVALDAGTTRDVVAHGETGLLLGAAELPRLGSLLADLLDDPERMARMGARAAEKIRTLLVTPRERMALEVDLYEKAAAAKRGARRGAQ